MLKCLIQTSIFHYSKNYSSLTHETRIKDAVNMGDLICLLATVHTLKSFTSLFWLQYILTCWLLAHITETWYARNMLTQSNQMSHILFLHFCITCLQHAKPLMQTPLKSVFPLRLCMHKFGPALCSTDFVKMCKKKMLGLVNWAYFQPEAIILEQELPQFMKVHTIGRS